MKRNKVFITALVMVSLPLSSCSLRQGFIDHFDNMVGTPFIKPEKIPRGYYFDSGERKSRYELIREDEHEKEYLFF